MGEMLRFELEGRCSIQLSYERDGMTNTGFLKIVHLKIIRVVCLIERRRSPTRSHRRLGSNKALLPGSVELPGWPLNSTRMSIAAVPCALDAR